MAFARVILACMRRQKSFSFDCGICLPRLKMSECHHCKAAIRSESGLKCEGICKKVYHCEKKCSGIDQYSRGILEAGSFIRFTCDDCVQYIHNVDMAIGYIQVNVKNKQTTSG